MGDLENDGPKNRRTKLQSTKMTDMENSTVCVIQEHSCV